MPTTSPNHPRYGQSGPVPTISFGGGDVVFERLVFRTGRWSGKFIDGSGKLEVSPGADPFPIPVMTGHGGDPQVVIRWEELYTWLKQEKKTRTDQMSRLEKIRDLVCEQSEDLYPASRVFRQREERLRALRQECLSPFVSDDARRLFACRGMSGLFFVYDIPGKFRSSLLINPRVPLMRIGVSSFGYESDPYDLVVLESAALPLAQTLPWAEAAAFKGLLFSLRHSGPTTGAPKGPESRQAEAGGGGN